MSLDKDVVSRKLKIKQKNTKAMKILVCVGLVIGMFVGTAHSADSFNLLSRSRFQTVPCSLDENCYQGVAMVNFDGNRYQAIKLDVDSSDCLPMKTTRLTGSFLITPAQTTSLALVLGIYDGTNIIQESMYGLGPDNWNFTAPGKADLDVQLYERPVPPSKQLQIGISFQGPGASKDIAFLYWPSNSVSAGIAMHHSVGPFVFELQGVPLLNLYVKPQQPSLDEPISLTTTRVGKTLVQIGYPRGLINFSMEFKAIGPTPSGQEGWFQLPLITDPTLPGRLEIDSRMTTDGIAGIMFRIVRPSN